MVFLLAKWGVQVSKDPITPLGPPLGCPIGGRPIFLIFLSLPAHICHWKDFYVRVDELNWWFITYINFMELNWLLLFHFVNFQPLLSRKTELLWNVLIWRRVDLSHRWHVLHIRTLHLGWLSLLKLFNPPNLFNFNVKLLEFSIVSLILLPQLIVFHLQLLN